MKIKTLWTEKDEIGCCLGNGLVWWGTGGAQFTCNCLTESERLIQFRTFLVHGPDIKKKKTKRKKARKKKRE